MKTSKCLAVGRKEAMTCDVCGKCMWIRYDILPPFFWSFSYHSIKRCGVCSLSVKLGWNFGVKFNHKIVPNYLQHGVWYPWKLSMKILTTLRTNATNRWSTPRWESTLHLHPRRDTSGGANPKTLEEVWHQTSSKNWTYTSSNEGVTQVRFPNSKYLNLKMVSYFLLEMPFSMVKPKKDQQQKKEKTETVR